MGQLSFEFKHVNHMMKVGDRHGRLTVVGETHKIYGEKKGKPRMRRHLIVRCDCGNDENIVIRQRELLRRPRNTGCKGCRKERAKIKNEEKTAAKRERERKKTLKRQEEREKFENNLKEKKLKRICNGYYQKKCQCGAFFNISLKNNFEIRYSQYRVCSKCEKLEKELFRTWKHIKQMCEDENYRLRRNSLIEAPPCNRIWLEDKWEFYYYVIDVLGDKPSDEHYIVMIDKDLGYVEGNLRWITKSEHRREMNGTTGLEGSITHKSWESIKRVGCVESWHTSFRRFLDDVGVKGEGEFHFRPNKNEPYGPDNFEWRYIEGGRSSNKDYQSWLSRKNKYPWYMCEEWNNDYLQFLSDMGQRPEGAKLWRYDESQPASPTNAYWGYKKGHPIT